MKTKNLILALAVLASHISAFAQYSPTTIQQLANIEIKDDPNTANITEGVLIVNKNLLITPMFSTNDYYEYYQYGTNNLIIGTPGSSYSNSNRSILMGYGTFMSADYSILAGSGGYIRSSSNSILMGNGDLSYGNSALLLGNGTIYSMTRSIVAGNASIGSLENSIYLGANGTGSGIGTSIVLGTNGTYLSSIDRSIVVGAGQIGYAVDTISVGTVTADYGFEKSIIVGSNITSNDNSFGGPPIFAFLIGENLNIGIDSEYSAFGDTRLRYAVSMGKNNTSSMNFSYLMGEGLSSNSAYSVVVGKYNRMEPYEVVGTNTPFYDYRPIDMIFTVANGTSNANRSNALVVRRNGDTEISGEVRGKKFIVTEVGGGIPMGEFGRPAVSSE